MHLFIIGNPVSNYFATEISNNKKYNFWEAYSTINETLQLAINQQIRVNV